MIYFGYNKSQELALFRFFLKEAIEGQNEAFKTDLNKILTQTSAYVKGEIDNFQISNEYYNLIFFLSKSDENFFRTLGMQPQIADYKKLQAIVERQDATIAFT